MMAPIIANIKNYHIGILGCQELGLDVNKPSVRKKLHEEIRHLDHQHAINYASSPQSDMNSDRKFGGTFLHVQGKWTTRFTPILDDKTKPLSGKGYDPMGRWCWVTLRGNTN